jgi:DNA-directed RNA polymerase specialized sigma24 family protein
MNSNQNNDRNENVTNTEAALLLDAATANAEPPAGNDTATAGGTLDTTQLVASRDVVRYIGATLPRYGITLQEMPDAIAEVQTDAIESARTKRMPASAGEWKALAVTIATRWAIDRLREAEVREKYDAGLCEEPDAYASPTMHWEHRDPVDTKRYLAILKDLFDSGKMPEDGAEILWGKAEGVPHEEIAAELGVSTTVVDNRLSRMRATFHARLAALGMLVFLLVFLHIMLKPVGDVATPPPPPPRPVESAPDDRCPPWWDAGAPISRNSPSAIRGNCPLPD